MANDLTFSITRTRFDEDYSPADNSRLTTNFANLARGEHRQQNLRSALGMIDRRCNELASAGDPAGSAGDRFRVELDIVSVTAHFVDQGSAGEFPLLEMLDVAILDQHTGERHQGILGNNFSSYLRDYDFAVLLPSLSSVPDDFGQLHGQLFQRFLESSAFRSNFSAEPVVCISVSTSQTYRQTEYVHPVLGAEYEHEHSSLTDDYFGRMGMQVRYFMPAGGKAPLAFYSRGDVANDYSDLQLIGTISTMETFQQIYRPEIYNAITAAPSTYRPSLAHTDFSTPPVSYDREERSRLAITQGRYTEEHLVTPHRALLERWATSPAALTH
ncbi:MULTISPECIES: putative oxygenase MesX [unclassified Curtobacterium]|uniref:putative oxygenase MesX n=1 Tax=unclassified Curtobacterium TaxID=257496 RepID=UPI00226B2B6F|nr:MULTISPECIES: putative oxygenase MesX [unclassified Curtobacterium]